MRALVLGGAVAAVLISSSTAEHSEQGRPASGPVSQTEREELWLTNLFDRHADAGRPTSARPELLRGIEMRVGVPVRLAGLEGVGAQWVGADVVPWDSTSAALLRYQLRGHRVTVYIYDSERTPLRTLASLEPRVVRGAVVFVGEERGYCVAAIEASGLGHAVVADFVPEQCAELVTAIPTE